MRGGSGIITHILLLYPDGPSTGGRRNDDLVSFLSTENGFCLILVS